MSSTDVNGDRSGRAPAPRDSAIAADQPSRRTILKRAGVGGAAVIWAVPVVQSMTMPSALAAGSEEPGGGGNGVGDLEGVVWEVVKGEEVFIEGAIATLNDGSGRTATTSEDGYFAFFGVAAGPQSVTVTEIHYVPRTLAGVVPTDGVESLSFVMTQIPHVQVVFTWGEQPDDMDLHMSGPDGEGGRFDIGRLRPATTDFARMTLTDDDGDGPEKAAVTVSASHGAMFVPGSYHVWVHNFADEFFGRQNLAESEGSVTVFGKTGPQGTFVVGTATGDPTLFIWLVCTFDLDSDGNMSNLSQGNGYNQFVEGFEDSVF